MLEKAFVSRDDCIEAVRQILIQLYALHSKGLPAAQISRIEREAIFYLYEGLDKYGSHQPHSAAARARRSDAVFSLKDVTYDHAVPLATLRDGLREATSSLDAMREFLSRYIRGVVITREEDKKLNRGLRRSMPKGAQAYDLMARYRAVEIAFEEDDLRRILREEPSD
jgi:hypothetical protein